MSKSIRKSSGMAHLCHGILLDPLPTENDLKYTRVVLQTKQAARGVQDDCEASSAPTEMSTEDIENSAKNSIATDIKCIMDTFSKWCSNDEFEDTPSWCIASIDTAKGDARRGIAVYNIFHRTRMIVVRVQIHFGEDPGAYVVTFHRLRGCCVTFANAFVPQACYDFSKHSHFSLVNDVSAWVTRFEEELERITPEACAVDFAADSECSDDEKMHPVEAMGLILAQANQKDKPEIQASAASSCWEALNPLVEIEGVQCARAVVALLYRHMDKIKALLESDLEEIMYPTTQVLLRMTTFQDLGNARVFWLEVCPILNDKKKSCSEMIKMEIVKVLHRVRE
jgi:hypothetical protein